MASRNQIGPSSTWAIVLGVLVILLGIAAIASPLVAGVVTGLFLGWLFILGGVIQGIYTFQHHRSSGSIVLGLLLSVFSLIVGILLVADPWAGAVSLTLFVGVYFFFDGVFRVFLAFQLKSSSRWPWLLANGILMIILGILIWSEWPLNAPWMLGILVGVGLLINGLALLFFGVTAKNLSSS
ncbi:DUF308 domain-containing protein [Pseudanabaena sp. FACHB-2040]|uniref:HdeD family acid-resistance protein n=1 Tax=Pseudanabaena sp. FACHB-2040 TaxID=2692859 RepID=UPI00168381E3|nr:DUF308 domain-containing protein [Pseudanabaena sp. FACHB-2040]MBD0267851.1 DUF308 domain-containing protein [Cyanobacteria bacterium Co-bin8]MBD2256995.1 DUF308 domain-containing protein [Pseudanabaena sp. FACHB-2040]